MEKSWSETLQDILGGLATTYGTIETIKANSDLQKAKNSWQSLGLPYYPYNTNAAAAASYAGNSSSNMMLIGGLAIAIIGVVLLIKD